MASIWGDDKLAFSEIVKGDFVTGVEKVGSFHSSMHVILIGFGTESPMTKPLRTYPLGQKHFWTKSPMIISPRTKSPKVKTR